MKTGYIAMAMTSALLTVGLSPLAAAQYEARSMPEGIEIITVVGTHAAPEGIEVITVVGKRPAPTVASVCVNEVLAARASGVRNGSDRLDAQALDARHAARSAVRQAIHACIEQAQDATRS